VSVLIVASALAILLFRPEETAAGSVHRIFYVHLPAAFNSFFGAGIIALSGVGYLWSRNRLWDRIAKSAGVVTVILISVVLITGMIWGYVAWGTWWTWSPSLTLSLVLWLLYIGYVVLRLSLHDPERRATTGAVYGIIAMLDVPLVYLSIAVFPDIHSSSMVLTWPMRIILLLSTSALTLLTLGLIASLTRHAIPHVPTEPTSTPTSHAMA
jgi:heme exporter protein C